MVISAGQIGFPTKSCSFNLLTGWYLKIVLRLRTMAILFSGLKFLNYIDVEGASSETTFHDNILAYIVLL